MKKIVWILMTGMILTGTSVVYAEEAGSGSETTGTCTNGRVVTGLNGHDYCQSTGFFTWYAAMAWCQAQKRHLATIYEACDVDPSQPVPSSCGNIASDERKLSRDIWTSSNKDASSVYFVRIYGPTATYPRAASNNTALCW